ncbi:Nudix family hydrolase [Thiomicrorhabdus heinhorstiae]|uniref:8-oxo-dGTP diphosphatase n=1 Tax=Thiomicrorhabdus heinhorstiae TaxID=2748010 RepID=A0ABS0BXR3_9GAMM|nr:Nudix family hydrolase [Thiomicrorhabdus heinhorstiae]MBF6058587.1 Nudix family hydrolase [Thiomicrorhabdus heinhorstiae]
MDVLDIAVGVLRCEEEICLSLRQKHQSHADHWEFPGGKIEAGESIDEALKREFIEELGVQTDNWQPLIEIPWVYDKKGEEVSVRLHVYQTYDFDGTPHGKEGQLVRWFNQNELRELTFPQANQGILTALELGDRYAISGRFADSEDFSARLDKVLSDGIKLIQLRAKGLDEAEVLKLAQDNIDAIHKAGAKLMLNGTPEWLAQTRADGIQLASNQLFEYDSRPIGKDKLLGASTHNAEELTQALKIDADFILLSPVLPTATHPDMDALGWEAFAEMVKEIPVPVFALGGMKTELLNQAKLNGAQGIAAISEFWK